MPDSDKQPTPAVILVDDREVQVPSHDVSGRQIKQAAGISEDVELFDHEGQPVGDDQIVHVHKHEKFSALSAPVVISVNKKRVEVPHADVSGLEIKQAASVPEDFQLFDRHGDPVGNEQSIRVHKGEKFTAISGQDVS
jgi:hypothetical protein